MAGDKTSQKAESFSCDLEFHLDCAEKPSFSESIHACGICPASIQRWQQPSKQCLLQLAPRAEAHPIDSWPGLHNSQGKVFLCLPWLWPKTTTLPQPTPQSLPLYGSPGALLAVGSAYCSGSLTGPLDFALNFSLPATCAGSFLKAA